MNRTWLSVFIAFGFATAVNGTKPPFWAREGGAFLLKERYYVGKYFGSGSNSRVHLAWDTHPESTGYVAIKIATDVKMEVEKSFYLRQPGSFRKGGDLPGVVKVTEFIPLLAESEDGKYMNTIHDDFIRLEGSTHNFGNLEAMVMEFLGPSLADLLEKSDTFSPETILLLGEQFMDIIKGVHDEGYEHGDVKPENILTNQADITKIKLVDFGVSSETRGTLQQRKQSDKARITGAEEYCPEDTYYDEQPNPKGDLLSFGYTIVMFAEGFLYWDWDRLDIYFPHIPEGDHRMQQAKTYFRTNCSQFFHNQPILRDAMSEYFALLDKTGILASSDYGDFKKIFTKHLNKFQNPELQYAHFTKHEVVFCDMTGMEIGRAQNVKLSNSSQRGELVVPKSEIKTTVEQTRLVPKSKIKLRVREYDEVKPVKFESFDWIPIINEVWEREDTQNYYVTFEALMIPEIVEVKFIQANPPALWCSGENMHLYIGEGAENHLLIVNTMGLRTENGQALDPRQLHEDKISCRVRGTNGKEYISLQNVSYTLTQGGSLRVRFESIARIPMLLT